MPDPLKLDLADTTLVCIDIQQRPRTYWTPRRVKETFREGEAFTLDELNAAVDDYVIAKTQRDAFASSNLAGVLAGLGRRTLLLMGGHTRGCLGDTARTALTAGYRCVLVRDATYDVSILRWPLGIAEAPYTAVIDTAELLAAGE